MFGGWILFLCVCLVFFWCTGNKHLQMRAYDVLEHSVKYTSFFPDDEAPDGATSAAHAAAPIPSAPPPRAHKKLEDALRQSASRLSSPVHTKRRRVTPLQARTIAARQGWICPICKKFLDASFEIDHIQSLARGGRDDDNNLQAIHKIPCHVNKTSMENRG